MFERIAMSKYLLTIISALFLIQTAALCEVVPGADGRITYIGRTAVNDGSVSFDWTGTYLKVRFQGASLEMRVSDTGKNYYNVWLDGNMASKPDKVLKVTGADTTITVLSPADLQARFGKDKKAMKAPHQIILQKRTEGSQGRTTIKEFITDGTFMAADKPSGRVIEFIGDSYTCGYGTEASNTEHFSPETENQNLTYACATARYFGAEQVVLAHSGIGIVRNYNGKLNEGNMPGRYQNVFDAQDAPKWDPKASPLKPAITVIYLGTNDFSTRMQPAERAFTAAYINLLKQIKEFYGDGHPVLCMAPKHDILQLRYIMEAAKASGLGGIHVMGLGASVHNDTTDMGADGHPNYNGHLKIAHSVIPYISTITGWEMMDSPVK
jgi:lysophospholipase L1-like esterase